MEINTFAPVEYKGHMIYVRNWKDHFEFLTFIKEKLYTKHIRIRPNFWNLMLYFLGINGSIYSEKQKNDNYEYLLRGAKNTIDTFYFKK